MSPGMYNRLDNLRVIVDEMLLKMTDATLARNAYVQLYGASGFAAMLAAKRGLNQEIAAIAGLMHDYYAFKTGITEFNDQNSAEAVRPIVRDLGIFTNDERKTILCAIFHQTELGSIHDDYDELIKDAVVVQRYFYNVGKKVPSKEAWRVKNALRELALPYDFEATDEVFENNETSSKRNQVDKRRMLADVAEKLASLGIEGIPADHNYRDICRYWPEDKIYQGIKGSWCAAFVYHCCRKAGFLLPIRYPNGMCRFAGVGAWQEWAKLPDVNFFHSASDKGFTPLRGDIVIYEKLLTDEPHDHIGVVLSCEQEDLFVAEGNMDNKNKSSLVHRNRWGKISGYIRIDNGYHYKFCGEYNPRLD
ncbi:MAG: hypothetical protein JWN30_1237 [Bacilli bacterium]|nr:hypothetical protein [Bacilli bacterium]